MNWADIGLVNQILAVVATLGAVGGFIFVAGYGRLWFRNKPAVKK